jgi:hypothetical protein
MNGEKDFGANVAARLKAGSRDDYELVQKLVVRAQKTQNWTYGDMLMQIVWALLPGDAQDSIAEQEPTLIDDAALPPKARLRSALRTHLDYETFASWFQALRLETIEGSTVTVSVPVKFLATWIESHYGDDLLRCCRIAFGTIERVEIQVRRPGMLH